MNTFDALTRGALAVGALAIGLTVAQTTAQADEFVLRVSAGLPSAPLVPIDQVNKTLVPNVAKRVAAETDGGGTAEILRTQVAGSVLGMRTPQTRDGYLKLAHLAAD